MIHTGAMIQSSATEIPLRGASGSCVPPVRASEPGPDFTEMKDPQQLSVKGETRLFVDSHHTLRSLMKTLEHRI